MPRAEAPKRRSAEAPKRRSAEAPKRRSAEAPKRRSNEATKRRSNEAMKQQSNEATKRQRARRPSLHSAPPAPCANFVPPNFPALVKKRLRSAPIMWCEAAKAAPDGGSPPWHERCLNSCT